MEQKYLQLLSKPFIKTPHTNSQHGSSLWQELIEQISNGNPQTTKSCNLK